jgi:hypothetical protein
VTKAANTGNATEVFEFKTGKIHEVFCSTTHALTMSSNSVYKF